MQLTTHHAIRNTPPTAWTRTHPEAGLRVSAPCSRELSHARSREHAGGARTCACPSAAERNTAARTSSARPSKAQHIRAICAQPLHTVHTSGDMYAMSPRDIYVHQPPNHGAHRRQLQHPRALAARLLPPRNTGADVIQNPSHEIIP